MPEEKDQGEYALSKNWNEIKIGRSCLPPFIRMGAAGGAAQTGASTIPGGKRPSSTRKLVCPKCGQSVRATKKVNILCGDCMMQMVEAGLAIDHLAEHPSRCEREAAFLF